MSMEKGSEKNLARNMLGIAPKVLVGWVALHGASDFPAQAAEIPNGTPWERGLTMIYEDAQSKPYEVGGVVISRANGKHEWRAWREGEMPQGEREAPGVNTPYKVIAENLSVVKSDGDYVCVVHSHIKPKVLGLNITSMPPSPQDLFSTVMVAVSPHIPANGVGKIKFGVIDSLGVWSYQLADLPQRLREQIKVQKDLDTYIKDHQQNYNEAMRAGLDWTVHVGEMELSSNFKTLSDAKKVERLRESRKYREFQKTYLDAGFIVTYATRDEAAKGAPCDANVGK